ncbi:MAG TPA: hypothetical protein VFB07_01355 [Vicinamibacterales bacterium]|nr:hypothetical protein [Vicinamibacterales bacterium]
MKANETPSRWLPRIDFGTLMAVMALAISGLSFHRSYLYTKQDLQITVSEVSYMTNQGGVYMTIAFSNGGNRDAAILRVEPALWEKSGSQPSWRALGDKVHPDIPVTVPKTPFVVKAGGVEVATLSATLRPGDAEQSALSADGGAFLGIRVETMNSDGNLYRLEHAVARLTLDKTGRIKSAEAAIHQTLPGFEDVRVAPPGDRLQSNKQTPFVWADQES